MEPGEQALDLPVPPIAPQQPAVLGPVPAIGAVRRVCDGRQPADLTVEELRRRTYLPLDRGIQKMKQCGGFIGIEAARSLPKHKDNSDKSS